jgi:predicted O-methyltransferase YrrM
LPSSDVATASAVEPRMRALAAAMHSFNKYVASEPTLQPLLLPLRDGLTVIRYAPTSAQSP